MLLCFFPQDLLLSPETLWPLIPSKVISYADLLFTEAEGEIWSSKNYIFFFDWLDCERMA